MAPQVEYYSQRFVAGGAGLEHARAEVKDERPEMARGVALDYVEHAFFTVTTESTLLLLCGEFGVSIACIDRSVQQASPVFFFCWVREGGA